MQTLYSYKGNTPIIAQYGVHELLGSHVDGNKTKEINHREIAIAIERPQSNAAGSAQGRPRVVSKEAQQGAGRGWCVCKTTG